MICFNEVLLLWPSFALDRASHGNLSVWPQRFDLGNDASFGQYASLKLSTAISKKQMFEECVKYHAKWLEEIVHVHWEGWVRQAILVPKGTARRCV